jgi:hypothetical protein
VFLKKTNYPLMRMEKPCSSMYRVRCRLVACIAFHLIALLPSYAEWTVNWSSVLDGEPMVYANGTTTIPAGGATFRLGTFATGFTPTASNLALWEANFEVFDDASASYSPAEGYVAGSQQIVPVSFGNSSGYSTYYGDPPVGSPVFEEGSRAYLWVYTTLDLNDPSAQWALIEGPINGDPLPNNGSWVFPNASIFSSCCDTLDWTLSNATTTIVGMVNMPGFQIKLQQVPEVNAFSLVCGALMMLTTLRWRIRKGSASLRP